MSFLANLHLARKDFFKLKKHRDAPAWALWLMTYIVASLWGLGFLLITALFGGKLLDLSFWIRQGGPFLATSMVIGAVFHIVFTLIERKASETFIDWTNGPPGLAVNLFFILISVACVALGLLVASLLLGGLPGMRQLDWTPTRAWFSVAAFGIGISAVWGWMASQQWQEEQLRRQAQEAQLRLLQAQIEPHYLFNTLANVRSLIDCDPKEAGELLDAFTDHLRASLTSMRAESVTLEQELALIEHYLRLMQLRMGAQRLRYRIEAEAATRQRLVPPLLLQPLVENALHHGLECCVEGGEVVVKAYEQQGRLRIEVRDNGVGLDAPSQRRDIKKGAGVATQNIRDRLLARFGDDARLTLQAAEPRGALATLDLPLPA